ncbi:MAG: hypothetical protein R3Y32_08475 [Bacillota bacterium]
MNKFINIYEVREIGKMVKIMIATATRDEFENMIKEIKPIKFKTNSGVFCYCGERNIQFYIGKFGGQNVVLFKSPHIGVGNHLSMDIVLRYALEKFSVSSVFNIGICCGIKSSSGDVLAGVNEQKIGDINVSLSVINYEPERQGVERVSRAVHFLPNDMYTAFSNYYSSRGAKYNVFFGDILSGAKLLDNIKKRDDYKNLYPEAIALEMEGASVAAICQFKKIEWLIIKGVSDYGMKKADNKEENTKLAMANVIHYVKQVFRGKMFDDQNELISYNFEKLEYFVGTANLNKLEKNLSKNKCVCISGDGGIGKTSLAIKYSLENLKKYNKTFFVKYNGSLWSSLVNGIHFKGMDDIMDYNIRKKIIAEELSKLDSSYLLIIDNYNTSDENFQEIYSLPVTIIFTTRNENNCNNMTIEPLSLSDLRSIFYNNYRCKISKQIIKQLNELFELMHRNTLLIELFSKYVPYSNNSLTQEICAIKENYIKKLKEVNAKVKVPHNQNYSYIKIHLKYLYDIANLQTSEIEILRILSVCGINGIKNRDLISFLKVSRCDIMSLIQSGWLKNNQNTCFIHDMIADICYDELDPTYKSCKIFIRNINDVFQEKILASWHTLVGYYYIYSGMLDKLPKDKDVEIEDYYLVHSRFGAICQNSYRYDIGIEKLKKLNDYPNASLFAKTEYLHHLGILYWRQGDLQNAKLTLESVCELDESINADYYDDRCVTLNTLATIHNDLMNHDRAIGLLEESLLLSKNIAKKEAKHELQAHAFGEMGRIYGLLGQSEYAIENYVKSIVMRLELYTDLNNVNLGNVICNFVYFCIINNSLKYVKILLSIADKIYSITNLEDDYHKAKQIMLKIEAGISINEKLDIERIIEISKTASTGLEYDIMVRIILYQYKIYGCDKYCLTEKLYDLYPKILFSNWTQNIFLLVIKFLLAKENSMEQQKLHSRINDFLNAKNIEGSHYIKKIINEIILNENIDCSSEISNMLDSGMAEILDKLHSVTKN